MQQIAHRVRLFALLTIPLIVAILFVSARWKIAHSKKLMVAVTTGTPLVSPIELLTWRSAPSGSVSFDIQHHLTGKAAFDALLSGDADLATVAETPLVHAAGRGIGVEIIATLATSSKNIQIIGREDRGVNQSASSLIGKIIGVPFGTNNEYYLHEFLRNHSLSPDQVSLVNFNPLELTSAIISGTVDAAVMWPPYISEVQKKLPGVVSMPSGNFYTTYYFLVAREGFSAVHPGLAQDIRDALTRCAKFIGDDIAQLAKVLHFEENILQGILPNYNFPIISSKVDLDACLNQVNWSSKGEANRAKLTADRLKMFFSQVIKN
jgi:NitT/TauT family transport system substrate-binding protein